MLAYMYALTLAESSMHFRRITASIDTPTAGLLLLLQPSGLTSRTPRLPGAGRDQRIRPTNGSELRTHERSDWSSAIGAICSSHGIMI